MPLDCSWTRRKVVTMMSAKEFVSLWCCGRRRVSSSPRFGGECNKNATGSGGQNYRPRLSRNCL
eukprot:3310043-Amphidinium_carterae.1